MIRSAATDGQDTALSALFGKALSYLWRRDRLARFFLAGTALLGLGIQAFQVERWSRVYFLSHSAALTMVIVALLAGLEGLIVAKERRFWRRVALAYSFILASSLLFVYAPPPSAPFFVVLVSNLLFAAYYLVLVLAVESRPHQLTKQPLAGIERALARPVIFVFFLGLVVYLILIPIVVDFDNYLRMGSNFIYYLLLQAYLSIRLGYLAWSCGTRRWQVLYGTLASTQALLLLSSLAEVLGQVQGVALFDAPISDTLFGRFSDLAFYSFLIFSIAAARMRHAGLPHEQEVFDPSRTLGSAGVSNQTLAYALGLSMLHLGLERITLLPASTLPHREIFVLLCLFILSGFAWYQRRYLKSRLRSIPELDLEGPKAVSSEWDLRLILEHREAEKESGERRFIRTFHWCPDLLSLISRDEGRIIEANVAFERILGYPVADLLGKTTAELDLWCDPRDATALDKRLDEDGIVHQMATVWRHKKGEATKLLLTASRVELEDEKLILVLGRPADEGRAGELRPGEEEDARTEAIFERLGDAVHVVDADGRLILWNPAAERLFGWTMGEAVGKTEEEILGDTPELESDTIQSMIRKTRDGRRIELECWQTWALDPWGRPAVRIVVSREVSNG